MEGLDKADHDSQLNAALQKTIAEFAWARIQQGYSLEAMLEEIRLLRTVLLEEMQSNLLGLNISFMIPDIIRLQDRISQAEILAVRNFHKARQKPRSPKL